MYAHLHVDKYICTSTEHLGGRQDVRTFTCNTPGHSDAYVGWLHNGNELSITVDDQKYMLTLSDSNSMLTVSDIIHSDEGNYSCKYNTSGPMVYQEAGCLIVYGELKLSLCACSCMYMYIHSCRMANLQSFIMYTHDYKRNCVH